MRRRFDFWVVQVFIALVWGLFRGETGATLAWRLILMPAAAMAIHALLDRKRDHA